LVLLFVTLICSKFLRKKTKVRKRKILTEKPETVENVEGAFDTYVPKEQDGFDNYMPQSSVFGMGTNRCKREILAEKAEAAEDFAGEFETYAPKECDEFDTYVPSSPKKRKKIKRLGKRPNGWKQSVSRLFVEENGPETQNGYEEYSAW
uniref:Uncharacterized protein n=1 Tax=Gongylonema pulchrum TaxID=637853 RepID=A0A183D604_9BILA